MKKSIILTTICALLAAVAMAATAGDTFTASARLLAADGSVSYTYITCQIVDATSQQVQIGNNNNACISEYSAGMLVVPSSVIYLSSPYTVTRVSDWAFRLCNKLTGIELSNGIAEVGEFAFSGCSALRTVILPKSITRIETGAWFGCDALTDFYCYNRTPPTLEYYDPFERDNTNATLHVPAGTGNDYATQLTLSQPLWENWFNISEMDPEVGDVNCDGIVDIRDVVTLITYLLGNNPDPFSLIAADVNLDSTVSITDVTVLIGNLLGS